MVDMTEREMQSVKMSTLYELRLIFTQGEKKEYTTEKDWKEGGGLPPPRL